MGLSSEQVSSKRSSMKRQPHEQQDCEPLKCPRCDSTNTKFCYFNNYNESQPRHYCRACKRHWTKGGSLRNVPVGGGRKNRRIKKSPASPTVASATATNANTRITTPTTSNSNVSTHMAIQNSLQILTLPLVPDSQKNFLYQLLTHQAPLLLRHDSTDYTCDLDDKFSMGFKNGLSMGKTAMPLPVQLQNHCLQLPLSSSSYCGINLSSTTTAVQSSNVYDHGDEFETIEDTAINTSMIMSSTRGNHAQPWQVPIVDNGMDMPSSWNWDDIDSLVSTDLKNPEETLTFCDIIN